MAPRYFPLTNILLATAVLFALGNAVPVPKMHNEGDKTLILPTRNIWNNALSIKPRYSALDNLVPSREVRSSVRPRSEMPPRIVPRASIWVEATFDPREPVKRAKLGKRFSTSDEVSSSSIARAISDLKEPIMPRDSWNREPTTQAPNEDVSSQRLTHVKIAEDNEETNLEKRIGNREDDVASRDVENSPYGPSEQYSGSLWRRSSEEKALA